jgi:hypothetical protein
LNEDIKSLFKEKFPTGEDASQQDDTNIDDVSVQGDGVLNQEAARISAEEEAARIAAEEAARIAAEEAARIAAREASAKKAQALREAKLAEERKKKDAERIQKAKLEAEKAEKERLLALERTEARRKLNLKLPISGGKRKTQKKSNKKQKTKII